MQTAVNLQISFQNVYPLIREVHTVNTHANYVTIQKFYIIHVPVCFVLAIPQEASNMHFSALSSGMLFYLSMLFDGTLLPPQVG